MQRRKSGKARSEKCVIGSFLKEEIFLATRRCAGSKFTREGSETEKAPSF